MSCWSASSGAPCGAIYLMVKLPGQGGKEATLQLLCEYSATHEADDLAAVEFLAEKHGIVAHSSADLQVCIRHRKLRSKGKDATNS
eukprot:2702959-Amphidinium_carterae.1